MHTYKNQRPLVTLFVALPFILGGCDLEDADDLEERDLMLEDDQDADQSPPGDVVGEELGDQEMVPDDAPALTSAPDVQLSAAWTGWYDRDNPGGNGDYESSYLQAGVCSTPTAVECRTTSGLALWQTGENVTCSTGQVRCVHTEQPDGYCNYDYKVRFLCPSGGGGGGGGGGGLPPSL